MASKKPLLQGKGKTSAPTPSVAAAGPLKGATRALYRIVCGKGGQGPEMVVKGDSPSTHYVQFINIDAKTSGEGTKVDCVATLQWRELAGMNFDCTYDTKTGMFEDFEWTNGDEFGDGVGDGEGHVENVSISMKGKSYNETGEAVEKEVLHDSNNRFLFVVMGFYSDGEGVLYGKKVDGEFYDCALSDQEKTRLRLD